MISLPLLKTTRKLRYALTALAGSAALAVAATATATLSTDYNFKTIPYMYHVDHYGDLNVTIPLETPPGVGSLVPALALNYNSDLPLNVYGENSSGHNKYSSAHWAISGVPYIRNCLKKTYTVQIVNPYTISSSSDYKLCMVDGHSEVPFIQIDAGSGHKYYIPARLERDVTIDIRLYAHSEAQYTMWGDLRGKCPDVTLADSVGAYHIQSNRYILVNVELGTYQCFAMAENNPAATASAPFTNETHYLITRTVDGNGNSIEYSYYDSREASNSCVSDDLGTGTPFRSNRPQFIDYGRVGSNQNNNHSVRIEFDWADYSKLNCQQGGLANLRHFGDKSVENVPVRINVYTENSTQNATDHIANPLPTAAYSDDNRTSEYSYFFANANSTELVGLQRCHGSVFNAPNNLTYNTATKIVNYPSVGTLRCQVLGFEYNTATYENDNRDVAGQSGKGGLHKISQYMKDTTSSKSVVEYTIEPPPYGIDTMRKVTANGSITYHLLDQQVSSDGEKSLHMNGGTKKRIYKKKFVALDDWAQKNDGTKLYHVTETILESGDNDGWGTISHEYVYTSTDKKDAGKQWTFQHSQYSHNTGRFPKTIQVSKYEPGSSGILYTTNTKHELENYNSIANGGDGHYSVYKVVKTHHDRPDGKALLNDSRIAEAGYNFVTTKRFKYEKTTSTNANPVFHRHKLTEASIASCRKDDESHDCDDQGFKTTFNYDSSTGRLMDSFVYGNLSGQRTNNPNAAHTSTNRGRGVLTYKGYEYTLGGLVSKVEERLFAAEDEVSQSDAKNSDTSYTKKRSTHYEYNPDGVLVKMWSLDRHNNIVGVRKYKEYNYAFGGYGKIYRSTILGENGSPNDTESDMLVTYNTFDPFGDLLESQTGATIQHSESKLCFGDVCEYSNHASDQTDAQYVRHSYITTSFSMNRRGEIWSFYDKNERPFRKAKRKGTNTADEGVLIVFDRIVFDAWGRHIREYLPYNFNVGLTNPLDLTFSYQGYTEHGYLEYSELGAFNSQSNNDKRGFCLFYTSNTTDHSYTVTKKLYDKDGVGNYNNCDNADSSNLVSVTEEEYRPLGLYSVTEKDSNDNQTGKIVYVSHLGKSTDNHVSESRVSLETHAGDATFLNIEKSDHFGNVWEVNDKQIGHIIRRYNAFGDLKKVVTKSVVDNKDSLLIEKMKYDDFHRVLSKTRSYYPNSNGLDHNYDAAVESASYSADFTYDHCSINVDEERVLTAGHSLGQLCRVDFKNERKVAGETTHKQSAIFRTYDDSLRVVDEYSLDKDKGKVFALSMKYDNNGQIESITYPQVSGTLLKRFKVKYQYDLLGGLESIFDATNSASDYHDCTQSPATTTCPEIFHLESLSQHGIDKATMHAGKLRLHKDFDAQTGELKQIQLSKLNTTAYHNLRKQTFTYSKATSQLATLTDVWKSDASCFPNCSAYDMTYTSNFGYDARNQLTSNTWTGTGPTSNHPGGSIYAPAGNSYTNTLEYYDSGNIKSSQYSTGSIGLEKPIRIALGGTYSYSSTLSVAHGRSDGASTLPNASTNVERLTKIGNNYRFWYNHQGLVTAYPGIVNIEYDANRKPSVVTQLHNSSEKYTNFDYQGDRLSYLEEEFLFSPTVKTWFFGKHYQEIAIDNYNELTARHLVYAGGSRPVAAYKVVANVDNSKFRTTTAWFNGGASTISNMTIAENALNGDGGDHQDDLVLYKQSEDTVYFHAGTTVLDGYNPFPHMMHDSNASTRDFAYKAITYIDITKRNTNKYFNVKFAGNARLRVRKVGSTSWKTLIDDTQHVNTTDAEAHHRFNHTGQYELELVFYKSQPDPHTGVALFMKDTNEGNYASINSSAISHMNTYILNSNPGTNINMPGSFTRGLADSPSFLKTPLSTFLPVTFAEQNSPRLQYVHHTSPPQPIIVLPDPITDLDEMDDAIENGTLLGTTLIQHVNFSDGISGNSLVTGTPAQEFANMPIGNDNFAVEIHGHIYVEKAGNHHVVIVTDEGVSLDMEGHPLYRGITPDGEDLSLHRIPIKAEVDGASVPYVLRYFENTGPALLEAYIEYENGNFTTLLGGPVARFAQGRASQKETYSNEGADLAIDGNFENWSSTLTASGNWWQGILETPAAVHTLRIHNAQDYPNGCGMACRNRLDDFYVMVTDLHVDLNDLTQYPTIADASAAATWSSGLIDADALPANMEWGVYGFGGYRDFLDIILPANVSGQKIIIRYTDTKAQHLHLKEVEVNNIGHDDIFLDGLVAEEEASLGIETTRISGVLMERWHDITGNPVTNLTGSAQFPDEPNEVTLIDQLNFPDQRRDNYGSRLRTWLKPTVSGSYTIYTSGNNDYELWMSTDHDPENAVKVAGSQWTDPQQWNKYPTQQQHTVTLEADQLYYMETLQKDGAYQDHISVAWDGPVTTGIEIIGSQYFSVPKSLVQDLIFEGQGVLMERWDGAPVNNHVKTLSSYAFHPSSTVDAIDADKVARLSSFEYGNQGRDYYATRLSAILTPDVSGPYTFHIAGDDSVELRISENTDALNNQGEDNPLIHFYGWTDPEQWDKHAGHSSFDQNYDKFLVAGQEYYIEVVHRDYTNGDHVQLGWQKPDSSTIEIIGKEYLRIPDPVPEAVLLIGEQQDTYSTQSPDLAFDGDLATQSETLWTLGSWWQGMLEATTEVRKLRIHKAQAYPLSCTTWCNTQLPIESQYVQIALDDFHVVVLNEGVDLATTPPSQLPVGSVAWSSGLVDADSLPSGMSWDSASRNYLEINLPADIVGQQIVIYLDDSAGAKPLILREVEIN